MLWIISNERLKVMIAKRKILLGGVVILLVVLILSTLFGKKGLLQIREARHLQKELLVKMEKLKQEKEKLEKEVEQLRNNPAMVEEEARKRLWLTKPEEKILILPKSKDKEKE